MNYISVCSGIESASVAWEPLGAKALMFSEIEPFPSAVLAHHWPQVPNMGDMTLYRNWNRELLSMAEVLVGGPPCQAFSIAGKRNSLEDERGQLTLVYSNLIDHVDQIRKEDGKEPIIAIYENVLGILSSRDNAFGCFLGALAGEDCELQPSGERWTNAGIVYGPTRAVAWRILDAQYFGVAQRRRRVFVVASARDGFDPAAVLFESEGERRDTPPSRETGESFAGGTAEGSHAVAHRMTAIGQYTTYETASTMKARDYKDATDLVSYRSEVRRLTTVECARLQGFQDNHTQIPWRGKPAELCPDGPQYKAYGNSKAVPVIRWVGERLLRELAK